MATLSEVTDTIELEGVELQSKEKFLIQIQIKPYPQFAIKRESDDGDSETYLAGGFQNKGPHLDHFYQVISDFLAKRKIRLQPTLDNFVF